MHLIPRFLQLVRWFLAATQGTLRDRLAVRASRACVHRSHVTATSAEVVLSHLPQSTAQRQQAEMHPVFLEKSYLLVLHLGLRGRLLV